jgi:hypothetical protein
MVKGEALLFLAGHFFSKYPFSSSRTDTAEKILKEASPIAITGFSNVLINVPCVYRGFFIYPCPLKGRLRAAILLFLSSFTRHGFFPSPYLCLHKHLFFAL